MNTGADHVEGGPLFTVSVAASLTGMHAQTLRQYDRLGLVTPHRTKGRGRRYSQEDVERLREIQRLSKEEGVNLAGVKLVLALKDRLRDLQAEMEDLQEAFLAAGGPTRGVYTADPTGRVTLRPNRRAPFGEPSKSAAGRPRANTEAGVGTDSLKAGSSRKGLVPRRPYYWWYMRHAGFLPPVEKTGGDDNNGPDPQKGKKPDT